MSAHYTKPGQPSAPIEQSDTMPVYDMKTFAAYGEACYDAGRADHIAEVGQMAPLTQEQIQEIELRFMSLKRGEIVRAVVRATENAHRIASPKEAA